MILKAQDKEYNCGIFALNFLLSLYGKEVDTDELERICETTEDDGTSHVAIVKALRELNMTYVVEEGHTGREINNFPCLVNFQSDDDGHYGVIVCDVLVKGDFFEKYYIIYDPATGELIRMPKKKFHEIWFSSRYGFGWKLEIIGLNVMRGI